MGVKRLDRVRHDPSLACLNARPRTTVESQDDMRRVSLVAILVATALVRLGGATDALSDVRAALGGVTVLSLITSIHATGKIVLDSGKRDGTIEVYYRDPDSFARVTRTAVSASGAYSGTTDRDGRQVDRRLQPDREPDRGAFSMPDLVTDATVTTMKTGFRGKTPITGGRSGGAGRAGAPAAPLGSARQYAAFAIPLLAHLTSSYPAKVAASNDTVEFDGDDGMKWVLALDPVTRLPATLTRSGGTSLDTVITFSDYAKVDGVTWPFRIVTRAGDRLFEDVTIKKYEINKPIDDKVFR